MPKIQNLKFQIFLAPLVETVPGSVYGFLEVSLLCIIRV